MAIELATGYVSITASAKGIGKSLQGELEGPLSKSGKTAGTSAGKNFGTGLKSGIGNVEGVGKTAGASMAKGFGGSLKSGLSSVAGAGFFSPQVLGIAALGGAVKFAVSAASDLQEAMSKSDAVFRENAAEVQAWAKTASRAFGQSTAQALEAAGTFGNLFQAFGIGLEPATEMSKTLTELASDLASFNNTSVDEAILALRSGLSGETEPLKRYGVALTDARLKQEALGLGLISDVKAPLDAAAKSQAAYALIMKDTALAQGDFARTADGYANSMKTLQATVTDSAAQIGAALLPMLAKIIKGIADGISWLDKLGAHIQDLEKSTGTGSGDSGGGLVGQLGDLVGLDLDFSWGKDLADVSWGEFISGADQGGAAAQRAAVSTGILSDAAGRASREFASARGGAAGYSAQMQAVSNANNQVADSVSMAREGVRTYGQVIREANAALQEHLNLTLASVSSEFAATAAKNAFTTAVEAANVASDDLTTGVNEQQVAMDTATQSAVAAAEAQVRLAEDQAKATGATYTAEDAQNTLIGTLMDLASRSNGPVASAIGGIITKLQETGRQKPKPTLDVDDKASGKTDAAKAKLSAFAGANARGSIDLDTGRFHAALDRAYDRLRNLRLTNLGNFGLAGGARNWRGGWTMVGEQGPELVNLPRGSDVYTATQTAGMIGGGSGVAPAAQAVVISGNTFIGSGPEVTRLLSAKIQEGRRAGVQFLGS